MKLFLNSAACLLQECWHCEQIDCLRWFDTFWFLLRKISVNPIRKRRRGSWAGNVRDQITSPSWSCCPQAKVFKSQLLPQDPEPHPCLAWHHFKIPSSAASPILIMALAEIKTTLDSCPLPGKRKQQRDLILCFLFVSFSFFPSYSPFLPCPSPCPSLLLYGLLFANIQLQTILCVWQRKRFYCVVTPGGIWCLWCCLGWASPGKVNYLWPTLLGGRMVRHTSTPFPLASNRIGPSPEVPTLLTTVHLSVIMPLMGTSYLTSKPTDCRWRVGATEDIFPPKHFLKEVLLGVTPKSDQRICSCVSRASAGAQRVAKNMHSQS